MLGRGREQNKEADNVFTLGSSLFSRSSLGVFVVVVCCVFVFFFGGEGEEYFFTLQKISRCFGSSAISRLFS